MNNEGLFHQQRVEIFQRLAQLLHEAGGRRAVDGAVIVSENIANARSTGDTPGAEPYRRKTVTFATESRSYTNRNRSNHPLLIYKEALKLEN